MTSAAVKLPEPMTVAEFMSWKGDGTGTIYELVDGIVRAQDAPSDSHGTIHGNLCFEISRHLRANRSACRLVVGAGIRPRLHSDWNYRIPELAVTCKPNRTDVQQVPDPTLLVEILSPSNAKDTWSNIPLYATLPSVQEILIVDSTRLAAEILRRGPDGSWPHSPEPVEAGGTIRLDSIGLELALAEVYRGTHLAAAD